MNQAPSISVIAVLMPWGSVALAWGGYGGGGAGCVQLRQRGEGYMYSWCFVHLFYQCCNWRLWRLGQEVKIVPLTLGSVGVASKNGTPYCLKL